MLAALNGANNLILAFSHEANMIFLPLVLVHAISYTNKQIKETKNKNCSNFHFALESQNRKSL